MSDSAAAATTPMAMPMAGRDRMRRPHSRASIPPVQLSPWQSLTAALRDRNYLKTDPLVFGELWETHLGADTLPTAATVVGQGTAASSSATAVGTTPTKASRLPYYSAYSTTEVRICGLSLKSICAFALLRRKRVSDFDLNTLPPEVVRILVNRIDAVELATVDITPSLSPVLQTIMAKRWCRENILAVGRAAHQDFSDRTMWARHGMPESLIELTLRCRRQCMERLLVSFRSCSPVSRARAKAGPLFPPMGARLERRYWEHDNYFAYYSKVGADELIRACDGIVEKLRIPATFAQGPIQLLRHLKKCLVGELCLQRLSLEGTMALQAAVAVGGGFRVLHLTQASNSVLTQLLCGMRNWFSNWPRSTLLHGLQLSELEQLPPATALADFIDACYWLRSLCLEGSWHQEESSPSSSRPALLSWPGALDALTRCSELEMLSLEGAILTAGSCAADLLTGALRGSSHLQILCLDATEYTESPNLLMAGTALERSLATSPSVFTLRRIELRGAFLCTRDRGFPATLGKAIGACERLQVLEFSGATKGMCQPMARQAMVDFLNALGRGRVGGQLLSLTMIDCATGLAHHSAVSALEFFLSRQCCQLRALDLSRSLKPPHAARIVRSLQGIAAATTLWRLHLDGCGLDTEAAEALASLLRGGRDMTSAATAALSVVSLADNPLNQISFTTWLIPALQARARAGLSRLTRLNVNRAHGLTPEIASRMKGHVVKILAELPGIVSDYSIEDT